MATTIPVLDLAFFLLEKTQTPMHVAALMVFDLPEGAGERYVAELASAYRKGTAIAPFNRVAEFPVLGMPRWVKAERLDMKYHVRHTALPSGATRDDVLDLVADLHSQMLDRSRPCFRVYFIEGLPDRQFAMLVKIHHAMVDGASAIARIAGSLDESPGAHAVRPVYTIGFGGSGASPDARAPRARALASLKSIALKQTAALASLYATLLRKGLRRGAACTGSVPFTAPRAPMNAPLQAGRSFATLSLPLATMKAVGKQFGGTLNDVALTVVDAALHRYLRERSAESDRALVALCPLSLRAEGDKEATTKASTMFVPLGGPKLGIAKRMQAVMRATASAKAEVLGMRKDAAMLYSLVAFGVSDIAVRSGADAVVLPMANLVISNVPGPRTDLYLRGARMRSIYPVSALGAGVGLNVTLLSYAGSLDFGFVGNGVSMPELDHVAVYTRDAFDALRRAAARRPKLAEAEATPEVSKPRASKSRASKARTSASRKRSEASR